MALERFEIDLTPHPPDEQHDLTLSEFLSNAIHDYHAEHPKLRMQDVQNAIRRVEAELLNQSEDSYELPPEAPRESERSRRFTIMTTMLILLSAIAMFAALELIRRP
jgi:hypothetical protein